MNVNYYIELKFMALKELTLQLYAIIKDRQYVLFKLIQEKYLEVTHRYHGMARVNIKLILIMSLLYFLCKINALLRSNRETNIRYTLVQIILLVWVAVMISIFLMIVT